MEEALRRAALELELSPLPGESGALREAIENRLRELISNDINLLTSLLYRLDVDELKIANALKDQQGKDAAVIIADLIIERQAERIRSRNTEFGFRSDPDIPADEKW